MFPEKERPNTMSSMSSVGCALLGLSLLVSGCANKSDPAVTDGGVTDGAAPADAGKGGSVSCYSDVQFVCEERQPPSTTDQAEALRIACTSGSGELREPATCPAPGFLGKCSVATGELAGQVRRYYTGADAAYQKDFCVNTAKGAWSTTF
jgi:hypothetical protein